MAWVILSLLITNPAGLASFTSQPIATVDSFTLIDKCNLFLMPMKAQAAPDPRLWHWIGSDDEIGFFVSTGIPTRYNTGVKQWIMTVKADGRYDVSLSGFRWNNGKETALLQVTKYNIDGKVIGSTNISYIEWFSVIPGSYGEDIWDYVNSQVKHM